MSGLIDCTKRAAGHGVDVIVTIHDYQWILTLDHIPPSPDQYAVAPKKPEFLQQVKELFSLAKAIIYPSRTVYNHHAENGLLNDRSILVPHPDIPEFHDRINIPVVDKTIHVAFIGNFIPYKGAIMFAMTSMNMRASNYKFHVFGDAHGNDANAGELNLTFHGKYQDKDIYRLLDENNIHIVVSISLAMETWCYALSRMVNSGRALVYLNRGASRTRLDSSTHPRYVAIEHDSPGALVDGLNRAAFFVRKHGGKETFALPENHADLVTPAWYKEYYL